MPELKIQRALIGEVNCLPAKQQPVESRGQASDSRVIELVVRGFKNMSLPQETPQPQAAQPLQSEAKWVPGVINKKRAVRVKNEMSLTERYNLVIGRYNESGGEISELYQKLIFLCAEAKNRPQENKALLCLLYRDLGRLTLQNTDISSSYNTRYREAVTFWDCGAKLGSAECMHSLGIAYELGYGVAKNHEKADYCFTDSVKNAKEADSSIKKLNIRPYEQEDLKASEQSIFGRVAHAIDRNKGQCAKIMGIALGVLAAIAAIAGGAALTVFAPYIMVPVWIGVSLLTIPLVKLTFEAF